MAKVIFLKHDATCKQCGEFLPAGIRAKWYGRGIVYGLTCHAAPMKRLAEPDVSEPIGMGADDFYTETGLRLDAFID